MHDQPQTTFRVKSINTFFSWSFLLFFSGLTCIGPTVAFFETKPYPNLDSLLFFYLFAGVVGLMWVSYSIWQTTTIRFIDDSCFGVKKAGQSATQHRFNDILGYNERPGASKMGTFSELTVYLSDNWFVIRSNEFVDYLYLKAHFVRYGQSVAHRTVFTVAERNRLRWIIIGQSVLILMNIAFGYVAHNPVDKTPAQLVSITDVADHVREDRNKSRLTGLTISLRAFPDFSFFVSRKNYDTRLDKLVSAIQPRRPITLLLRQSDFRKKLVRTQPLTFGDKYVSYKEIMVFGVEQGNSVHLQTPRQVCEPTHTNPLQRTCLFSILLLFCWTGWVYVDRQAVIGAE